MISLLQKFTVLMLIWVPRPSLSQTLNANNYIWIDYSSKVSLNPKNELYYSASLPCKARIGSCFYNFTLLPPGWRSEDDKLLIPKSQVDRTSSYAVQLTASEITGQKLQFNLVLDIDDGVLTVHDRGEYFVQNFYLPPQNEATLFPSTTTSELKNFPTFQQIQSTIRTRKIPEISKIISDILKGEEQCSKKIRYLEDVQSIVKNQIDANIGEIRLGNETLSDLNNRKKKFEAEKNYLTAQLKNDQKFQNLNAEIERLKSRKKVSTDLQYQYSIVASNYLKKIEESTGTAKTTTQNNQAIEKLESQIKNLTLQIETMEKMITDLTYKLKSAEALIATKNLHLLQVKAQTDGVLDIDQLQANYKLYSELALEEKVKTNQIDYDINHLSGQLATKQSATISTDKKIADLNKQISKAEQSIAQKNIAEVQNANEILKSGLLNLKYEEQSLSAKC